MKDLIKIYQKQVDDNLKNKSFTKQDLEDFKRVCKKFCVNGI